MNINPDVKSVGELALEVPHAITILEKWKIDYCCHGGQSVTDACARAGVDVNELLAAIGGDRSIEGDRNWQSEPLGNLTKYIVETHHVFTKDIIETWIDYKRKNEVDAIRLRPHPWEFALYFDI